MISAGEASGDMHAGNMLAALRKLGIQARFHGMGGPSLQAEGMELIVDCRDLAVVGIVEVLFQYRRIMGELEKLRQAMRLNPPDLLVLVDYPEFNLKLAESARELGVKVLFYVSPQVWAWRAHRVKRIGTLVDMMAVLFPFEVDYYRSANIPVRHVGHPLLDEVHPTWDKVEAKRHFGIDNGRQTVSLLPGSRRGEVKRILPVMLRAASLLNRTHGPLNFLLAQAPTLDSATFAAHLGTTDITLNLIEEKNYDVIQVSDAVITASGTATLEIGLLGVPMAIVYRVNPLTYAILARLMTVDSIGLVNIVSERRVVAEFVQGAARPQAIAAEVGRILSDADYANRIRSALAKVREKMGRGDGSRRVAQLALEMLEA
jgi:lipid-A-disaccharide synthase